MKFDGEAVRDWLECRRLPENILSCVGEIRELKPIWDGI